MPNPPSAAARTLTTGRRRRRFSSPRRSAPAGTRGPVAPEVLEPRTFLSVSHDANGWTVVTPESDSRVIYVSSSGGSDGNTGRSADKPVKTLGKAQGLVRDGSADQMLLKRGDVWTNETFNGWWKSGRSEDEPIVIGAYGTGARPRLDTGAATAFYAGSGENSPIDNVFLIGLHFSAHTRLPGSGFVSAEGSAGIRLLAPTDNFLIEDSFIQGYRDNIILQDFFGPLTDVTIRRSIIADAYGNNSHAAGLFAQGVDRLTLEENLFDHNGWIEGVKGAGQTAFNHNVYMRADNTDVVVRGNVFSRASSHGLQARSGGVIENNLFIDNPIAMSFGLVNGSPATAGGVTGRVTGNVFAGGGESTIAGSVRGWALDLGNTKPGAGTTVSNNLFTGNTKGQFPAIVLTVGGNVENFSETAGINDLTIRDNVVYGWAEGMRLSPGLKPGVSGPSGLNGLVVKDNDFQHLGSESILHDVPFVKTAETWSGNRYDDPEITQQYYGVSFDKWRKDREPTAKQTKVKYDDASRTIPGYSKSLGNGESEDAFLAALRKQSSQSWDTRLTAAAANAYMQKGFGEGGVPVWTQPAGQQVAPPPVAPQPGGGGGTPQQPQPEAPVDGTPTAPVQPDPGAGESPTPAAPVAPAELPKQVSVTAGDTSLTFAVTYVAAEAGAPIDLAGVDDEALRVVGRGGFDQPATLVSVQQVSPESAVATYSVANPDGTFERGDAGRYAVVTDAAAGDPAAAPAEPADALAAFKLTVAKPPPAPKPDTLPYVKKLKFAPRGASSVTVWFSEDVSLSVDAADLFLMAEDGSRVIDPALTSVSYDPAKNCATWTFPGLPDGALPKGKLHLALAGWGIADSAGQTLDGDRDGVSGDDYAPAKWFRV